MSSRANRLALPGADGSLRTYSLSGRSAPPPEDGEITGRVAYVATHVVADALADADPHGPPAIDWDATLGFRRYIWSLGLGVAEAMDTAQRGSGLDWATSRPLIERTLAEASPAGGLVAFGAGTDHLPAGGEHSLADVIGAYEEQVGFVESRGGRVILMASRALAAAARDTEDYVGVYAKVLSQVSRPVIVHWLGPMFDPALDGYWGATDPAAAVDVVAGLIGEHAARVDGIKVSLLDEALEVELRRLLPDGVRLYTGDDFNYPRLIRGDEQGHSDALLGVFDPIAPVAASALRALDQRNVEGYQHLLEPTVPLARHLFSTPTHAYKTGVVFLAYLNGHQKHFRMIGGAESARSLVHLARAFELADRAGALVDPELAVERLRLVLALGGVDV